MSELSTTSNGCTCVEDTPITLLVMEHYPIRQVFLPQV